MPFDEGAIEAVATATTASARSRRRRFASAIQLLTAPQA